MPNTGLSLESFFEKPKKRGKCACHPCNLFNLTIEELADHIAKEHVDAFYNKIRGGLRRRNARG